MGQKLKRKYGNPVSLDEIIQIRATIAEKTSHLSQYETFQVGKLVKLVTELSPYSFTINQLRHLRRVHLIRPDIDDSGERTTHRYTRADLQDVLVILSLIKDHHLPLSKIGGLLWAEERQHHTRLAHSTRGSPISMPHNQMKRMQFLLRGRLFEIATTWLFGGQVLCNAIILLRRQVFPHRTEINTSIRIIADGVDWIRVDKDKMFYPRPDDIILMIGPNGEALHRLEPVEWTDFHDFRWHHILVQCDQPMADYHMIVGNPPTNNHCLTPVASMPITAKLLAPLLRLCFFQQVENGTSPAATPLQAMANIIPEISALWQYCAILTPGPDPSNTLVVLAQSDHFPRTLNLGTVFISPEQLLSGWSYRSNQVCVVQQSIGRDDPRIARQSEEQAVAAIAVPTLADGRVNGVIYVGTHQPAADKQTFTEAEIGILRLLGAIVGEIIERETISQRTRQTGLRTLNEPSFTMKAWPELVEYLEQVLLPIADIERSYDRVDNIHLMAVRVDNFAEIHTRSAEVAKWVTELLARTASNFYRTRHSVLPTVFQYSPAQFVILVNHMRVDDPLEQKLRSELQDYLSTLILSFDQGIHPTPVKCLVWSLPFRYSDLATKLTQTDERSLALVLQQEIETVLTTMSHISLAHQYEAQGAYSLAYQEIFLAHKRAPHNTYLMRHLAKLSTRLGEYTNAIGWWQRVLNYEQHPRFYQHLAEVYAMLPDYPTALEQYRLAAELGPNDPRCFLGWGQVLLAMGEHEAAIEKFATAQELDQHNQVLYALREAEAYIGLGDYSQAKWACERALILDRDNPDALKFLFQILPKL